MGVEITTISVSPENADGLREVRDARDLRSMDAALGELLETARKTTQKNAESTD